MRTFLALTAGALLVWSAAAQLPPSPAFETASVKAVPESVDYPPRAGYWIAPRVENPQRFRARIQLSKLITWAFGIRDFQLLGGPEWIREGYVRFEVQAAATQPSSPVEMKQMLQSLLADRFKLQVHRSTQEMPVYALVPGRIGPKLTASENSTPRDGTIEVGNGNLIARRASIPSLVQILTDNLERPVVDRTNLAGRYDFALHYELSSLVDGRLGPALFGLVQDIGLKLEPRKEQVELLIVDSVEQPSDN